MERDFFRANRRRIMERLPVDSLLVMLSGEPILNRGDQFFPFEPKRNFYYITGIDKPYAAYIALKTTDNSDETTSSESLAGISESLFIRTIDAELAKWNDDFIDIDEARDISRVFDIKPLSELFKRLSDCLSGGKVKRVYLDLKNNSIDSKTDETILAKRIRDSYPAIAIMDIHKDFAEQRLVKQPDEIECIRSAIAVTGEGLELITRNIRPGMAEYCASAYFEFAVKRKGMRLAFAPIAASGINATILHYASGNSIIKQGELLLVDVGAGSGWYSADITRTYPISGEFSARQRELYEIVLAGQQEVINSIRPGLPFSALNEILIAHYERELPKVGLGKTSKDIREYYYHNVSHMLGLETHDAERGTEGILQSGMVFTVEPGLYVKEEGIGIRIEDDVLVTEDGAEVLSAAIPKEPESIERLMIG